MSAVQTSIALLQYEPTIEELRHKYEAAMKEKMLVKLEKDRLAARSEALQAQVRCTQGHMVGGWDLLPVAHGAAASSAPVAFSLPLACQKAQVG